MALRTGEHSLKDGHTGFTGAAAQASTKPAANPRHAPGAPRLRRDLSDDFAGRRSVASAFGDDPSDDFIPRRRFSGLRFRLRGGVPRSVLGRVLAGTALLGLMAAFTAGLWGARSLLLHDPRLAIASSSSIQTTGNSHLTRAQLLAIFGGDVDRNILNMPLAERRHELESLPWVEHATVMRLLPDKVRVAIVERTPIAFVRQGRHIGLVDAHGVLLEMSPDVPADQHYSFPVLTGLTASEPESTRSARMKLYQRFVGELDAGSTKISARLSEVDLSSPEDVMALIPVGAADILVHLGDDDFLPRYERFERNIAEWKTTHPNLASVDMRYDREAVLEMKPGTVVALNTAPAAAAPAAGKPAHGAGTAPRGAAKPKPAATRKPHATATGKSPAAPSGGHLQTAFAVHPKSADSASATPHPTQAAHP